MMNGCHAFPKVTELPFPYRQMVFLAATTGLRASELLGLKWDDIDFDLQEIRLNRGVVSRVAGDLKTEASRKPLPLDPASRPRRCSITSCKVASVAI